MTISGRPADDVAADLLVLPVAAGDGEPLAPAPAPTRMLPQRVGAQLGALGRDGQLVGELDQGLLLPTYGRLDVPALLLLGVGRDSDRTLETLRRAQVAVRATASARLHGPQPHRAAGGVVRPAA